MFKTRKFKIKVTACYEGDIRVDVPDFMSREQAIDYVSHNIENVLSFWKTAPVNAVFVPGHTGIDADSCNFLK